DAFRTSTGACSALPLLSRCMAAAANRPAACLPVGPASDSILPDIYLDPYGLGQWNALCLVASVRLSVGLAWFNLRVLRRDLQRARHGCDPNLGCASAAKNPRTF